MKIIIYDSNRNRWESQEQEAREPFNALIFARDKIFGSETEIILSGKEDNKFIESFNNNDLLLLHETDIRDHLYNNAKMDLKGKEGPKIIKFSGGAAREAIGENRERVFVLELPIEDTIFTKAETWKAILKYISDPKNQSKPACMGLSLQYISLRSQILSPFVALPLALQYAEENKYFDFMKSECNAACEEITKNDNDKKLREFLEQNRLDERYNELKAKIDGLCKAIADNKTGELANFKDLYEGHNSDSGLIGDFANMLEGVINRADFKKKIITLRHNIKNLLGTIDPNINALKNADKQAVREEWSIAKEAILRSGIDRVEKEIKLYDEIRGTISKGNDIYEKLMEADKLYKVLFKAFSSNIEGDSIDSILKSGEALIQVLKDIIKKLEEMENA